MKIDASKMGFDDFSLTWTLKASDVGIHVGNRPDQIVVVDGDIVSVVRFRQYVRGLGRTDLFYEKIGDNHPHVVGLFIVQ